MKYFFLFSVVILIIIFFEMLVLKKKKLLKIRRSKRDGWPPRSGAPEGLPPSGHPVIDICLNFEEIRPYMVQLIQKATKEILLSTFNSSLFTPFYDNQTLNDFLYTAHSNGVDIKIILNQHQATYGGDTFESLRNLPYTIYRSRRDDCTLLEHTFCHHHQKFLCVDASYILIGGTETSKDATNKDFNTCDNRHIHCWSDMAVVTSCSPELYQFILKTSLSARYVNSDCNDDPYFGNGDNECSMYINLTRAAQKYIYIENQVFISNDYTENRLLEEICVKIVASIENHTPFKVFIVTNDYHTTTDECRKVRKYIDLHTKSIRKNAGRICKRINKNITGDQIGQRLFIGTLQYKMWPVKLHTQMFVQDGKRMIKGSSNITDRSLSSSPCDKELTVLFHDPTKISDFMQKLWNHRFNTHGVKYRYPTAFDFAKREIGQYKNVTSSALDQILFSVMSNINLFLEADGPCRKGVFEQTTKILKS